MTDKNVVTGARKAVVKARIWLRIGGIALRKYPKPNRAAAALRRMIAVRSRVQTWTTQRYYRAGSRYFWNLYAPGFPSRAFDAYVAHELDRMDAFGGARPALQTVVLAITKRCALRCEHCCEWQVLNAPESLSGENLRCIVERIRVRGTSQLFLSGGEPLRRFGELLSVAELASNDIDVWILTSGHGLTRERAQRLRHAGLTGVAISLDHWRSDRHDAFRGMAGSFEAAVAAAGHARAAGLVVALSLCPSRDFVSPENLDRYADLASRIGASFIQLLEPKAIGHWATQDVALSAEQQSALEAFALRVNADPAFRHLPAISYPDAASRRLGCRGAGDRHLYIDTDGDVHPCPFCRTSSGNALEGDFNETVARLQSRGCLIPEANYDG